MGRNNRASTNSIGITVRMADEEIAILDRYVHEHNLTSRSNGIRKAILEAAGFSVSVAKPEEIILDRMERIQSQPLVEQEPILPIGALLKKHDKEKVIVLLADLLRAHVQRYGWFYPPQDEDLHEVLLKISESLMPGPEYSGMGRAGIDFLKSQFPSFWETRKGPKELTFEGNAFQRNVEMAYDFAVGRKKDITLRSIRASFTSGHISFFRPAVAASIYRRWLKTKVPTVWDPSCGFGARMLGFFSQFPDGIYLGNEPATRTRRDLLRLASMLSANVSISPAGSEHASLEECSVDLVFTSPPYFKTEKYFEESGQVWIDYDSVESWVNGHILPTMSMAYRALRPGCFAIINTSQEHRGTYIVEAQKVGFTHVADEKLLLVKDHLVRITSGSKNSKTHEPILVFLKPL